MCGSKYECIATWFRNSDNNHHIWFAKHIHSDSFLNRFLRSECWFLQISNVPSVLNNRNLLFFFSESNKKYIREFGLRQWLLHKTGQYRVINYYKYFHSNIYIFIFDDILWEDILKNGLIDSCYWSLFPKHLNRFWCIRNKSIEVTDLLRQNDNVRSKPLNLCCSDAMRVAHVSSFHLFIRS